MKSLEASAAWSHSAFVGQVVGAVVPSATRDSIGVLETGCVVEASNFSISRTKQPSLQGQGAGRWPARQAGGGNVGVGASVLALSGS